MVFSSLEFLCWFLPFFLMIYYILPQRMRNGCILLFSVIFYGYGCQEHPEYLLLILLSVAVNYLLGRALGRFRFKKRVLTGGLIFNLGILFVFKYLDFFLEILKLPPVNLVLPIGISFYTFQIISYLVDVYRGTVEAEKNLINLGAYILMFPQLTAGPIVRYSKIRRQMKERTYSLHRFAAGVQLFILGLGAKVLLANQIGNLWREVNIIGFASVSTSLAWMAIAAYSLQLYFDFFGYSLMAVGLGKMMGFSLPRNFREPYAACSMTDFWRRWHITLGAWFREYVYIPLGGNRRGLACTYRNLLIVWLLTGFWHGANWNFLLWGFLLFAVISAEKAGLGRWLENHRLIGHLYMLLLIPLQWLVFAVEDLHDLAVYLGRLVGFGGENIFAGDISKYAGQYGWLLLIGLLLCTPLPARIYSVVKRKGIFWLLLAAILAASIYCIYMGMNDPFLYFRF